jgi:hypothetical protein
MERLWKKKFCLRKKLIKIEKPQLEECNRNTHDRITEDTRNLPVQQSLECLLLGTYLV